MHGDRWRAGAGARTPDALLPPGSSSPHVIHNILSSEYADHHGVPFATRVDVEMQTPRLMCHFEQWGMEVHAGKGGKPSKSQVLFCSAPLHTYSNSATFDGADFSDILMPGGLSMPVVDSFPYLGDIISRDGGDELAVDARVGAAGKAFVNALRLQRQLDGGDTEAGQSAGGDGAGQRMFEDGMESDASCHVAQRRHAQHAVHVGAHCRIHHRDVDGHVVERLV